MSSVFTAEDKLSSRRVSSCDVTRAVGIGRGDVTLNSVAQIHTLPPLCLRHVISAHVPARLSNFYCHTHFVRRDVRVEMEEMLTEKVRQRTFSCDTKSPDYTEQHMRANAWEGIGKELKIKR